MKFKRLLCLRFPHWPLQRQVVARPELKAWLAESSRNARAVLIHATDPRRGEIVRDASSAAFRRRTTIGMPLAEAIALFPDERDVKLLPHAPAADQKTLSALAERCERFSPLVGWETLAGARTVTASLPPLGEPDALWLDVTGIGPLFGGEERLIAAVRSDLRSLGLTATIAVGSTLAEAYALTESRSTKSLADVPVRALRIGDEAVDTLRSLGIRTAGELFALPRSGLASRLGEGASLRIDQALGLAEEWIVPCRPAPVFRAEWIAEHPTTREDEIRERLAGLLDRVTSALVARGEGASRVEVRLDQEGAPPARLETGLFQPTACPSHLLELIGLRLERLRLTGAIGRVCVDVTSAAALAFPQRELFAGGASVSPEQTARLVDRLRSRLGDEAVSQPIATADPLPERAVRWHVPRRRVSKRQALKRRSSRQSRERPEESPSAPAASGVPRLWGQRPLCLLPEPQPIEATAIAPDGPPIVFTHHGQRRRVLRRIGPERIETGWWRGPSVRRDYYRVETTTGAWWWLFRRLDDGRWFLHGMFD